jgi:hypothetical protein
VWEMSERLVAALTGGGTVATELEFFQRDDPIAVLDGLILEGTVTAERQTVRRHCDLTIIDREHLLTPSEASDLFGAWTAARSWCRWACSASRRLTASGPG